MPSSADSFRENGPLPFFSAHAMQFHDCSPAHIAFGIEGPVSRDENHRAKRRKVNR